MMTLFKNRDVLMMSRFKEIKWKDKLMRIFYKDINITQYIMNKEY
jgi:hypothetical protein